jgi:hypothetical protein
METLMTLLSKDIDDYFASTSTSTGAVGGTTIIDTALAAYESDWITDFSWDRITSGTYANESRKISSLSSTTLTTLAHGGQIASGVTYEVHRLFAPVEKLRALTQAVKLCYPYVYASTSDTTKTTSNWLLNGDVEVWASTSYPDYWRVSAVTAAETSTAKLFIRGASSCKLDSTAGYLYQDWTLNDNLKELRGTTVTFKAKGWCDTADSLRLAVSDGTTITYSSYHAGDSTWNTFSDFYVQVYIDKDATDVSFRVYLDESAATGYIDDLRVTSSRATERVYIGDLALAQGRPSAVQYALDYFPESDEQRYLRNWYIDGDYLVLPYCRQDTPLRILGRDYLSFLKAGVETEAYDATVAIDDPQTRIVSAQAALWLYNRTGLPNYSTGQRKDYQEAANYWSNEFQHRVNKFKMPQFPLLVKWGQS